MKAGKRIALLFGIILPYICAILAVAFYHAHHTGPIPRWISIAMLCFFVVTVLGAGISLPRAGRKQTALETVAERERPRKGAIKALKIGLVLWVIILLNDIRMLAQRSVRWEYALPGLAVVLLMVPVLWITLRRAQKTKLETSDLDPNQRPNP